MRLAITVALLLAGCAGPAQIIERPEPGVICDQRLLGLNHRLCAEAGGVLVPDPARPCGRCQR